MEGIQVSTEVRGSQNQISLIKVGGFIDTTTSSEVERALHNLLKQNRFNIIIDLGNVDYISSAGWGIFISEIKSIREQNGDLKLVRMIPDVYEIFELLEFHHILDVYDSVEDAVRKFEEPVTRPTAASMEKEFAEVRKPQIGGGPAATTPASQPRPTYAMVEEEEELELSGSEEGEKQASDASIGSARLEDKIKHIIARNPTVGAYKIKKILNTSRYGFTRVGWLAVRSVLNKMGLNNRKRRQGFARKIARDNQ
ncbi:MAG: anti-sigma factor antagonist [Calditrichaeota bacterium]|nr:STAS domain-containing protein [Calditrichota bacterium]RQV99853.1 MAG: anti-sigma factor antagonist [Calditrichota bacterium]